jgi:zinc protease
MRNLIFGLILFFAVSALPAQLRVKYERFTLPNGMNVILHEDHSLPIVAVNIWYHVGSDREKPGRTGFAHLFEHIMFEGSGHVGEKKFDEWLEAAGGSNNASTTTDRTNYYESGPISALELMLFLESDRAGYLLTSMSPAKVDGQRDVVKNERRQSYENRPYGMAELVLGENLYPPDHPYHWPVIGSMEDLTAASYEDVVDFFKKYYVPANASLCIAGDIDAARVPMLIEKWFSDVPKGAPVPPLGIPAVSLTQEKRVQLEDNVQLPRLYMAWLTPPSLTPGDAECDILASILAGDKNSRLYKRLVYEMQIAQDVSAFQASSGLGSVFQIIATARSGHTLKELESVIQEEIGKLKSASPTEREVKRAVNGFEASFLDRLEGVDGKADALNNYYTLTGNPDYFNEDLARYQALSPDDIQSTAQTFLKDDARVILSVVPKTKEGK